MSDHLVRIGTERFALTTAVVGEDELTVMVTDERGRPRRGVTVRYRRVSGRVQFVGHRGRTVSATTDFGGECSIPVRLTRPGVCLVTAELARNSNEILAFRGQTEGLADRITVHVPPTITATDGRIRVVASAIDHRGQPVTAGAFILVARHGAACQPIEGKLRVRGNLLIGTLLTRLAGCWTVTVQERTTKAQGDECVTVLPGAVAALEAVDDPDPRQAAPFSVAPLRARVRDVYDNDLSPENIRCSVNGRFVRPTALVGNQARWDLHAAGYRTLEVRLLDEAAELETAADILCAAAWIGGPLGVAAGTKFATPVYFTGPPRRRSLEGSIQISYDPKMVRLDGIERKRSRWVRGVELTEVEPGLVDLTIAASGDIGYRAQPDGLLACSLNWTCLGEGPACFTLTAEFSPRTFPWERCAEQKENLPTKQICVNFIYNVDDKRLASLNSKKNKAKMKKMLEDIYNADLAFQTCCPRVTFDLHYTRLRRAAWLDKVLKPAEVSNTDGSGTLAAGDSTPNLGRTWGPVGGTSEGIKMKCINVYLVDFDPGPKASTLGISTLGPHRDYGVTSGDMYGTSIVDPDHVLTSVTAHEVGHALGLNHDPPKRDVDELMYPNPTAATDTKIKRKGDCQEVYINTDILGG